MLTQVTLLNGSRTHYTKNEVIGNMRNIETIFLDSEEGTYEFQSEVVEALKSNTTVKTLDINDFVFNQESIAVIADMLQNNKTLKSLEFSACKFADNSFSKITASINKNNTLKKLHIHGFDLINCVEGTFNIDNDDVLSLAKMLECNTGLVELLISNTDLRDSFNYIAEALSNNKTLKNLSLENCNLSYDNLLQLFPVICNYNKTLRTINITANKFFTIRGDKALECIDKMIFKNLVLRSFTTGNAFYDSIIKRFLLNRKISIIKALSFIAGDKVTPLDFKILHLAFNHYEDVLMDDIAKQLNAANDPERVRNIIKAARYRYFTLTNGLSKTNDEGLFGMLPNEVRLIVRDYALPEAVDTFRLRAEKKAKSTQNQIAK